MAVAGCVIVKQSREAHVEMFPAEWRRLALAGVTSITGRIESQTRDGREGHGLSSPGSCHLPMQQKRVFKFNCASGVQRGCFAPSRSYQPPLQQGLMATKTILGLAKCRPDSTPQSALAHVDPASLVLALCCIRLNDLDSRQTFGGCPRAAPDLISSLLKTTSELFQNPHNISV